MTLSETLMEAVASKYLSKSQNNEEDVAANEEDVAHAVHAHEKVYNSDEEASSRDLGSAAALKAFQAFSSKGGGGSSDLMAMVMEEAGPLFSAKGGNADKGEMLETAAKMAMKLYSAHKSSGGDEGSSGGMGSLMGLLGGGNSGTSGMAVNILSKLM